MTLNNNNELPLTEIRLPLEEIKPYCLTERNHRTSKSQSLNIISSIATKRCEIKKLIYKKVGDIEIVRRGERKPTSLVKLEQGMKTFFFGENGHVTSEFPSLKKKIRLDKIRKKLKLNEKIDAGALTYLFLKGNETQIDLRRDILQRKALTRSTNFDIKIDKDIDLKQFLKEKVKEEKENLKEINKNPLKQKQNNTISRNMRNNEDSENSILPKSNTISIETHYKTLSQPISKNINSKKIAKILIKKAGSIEDKQEKLDKVLCKIIDHAEMQKPLSVYIKKDIEAIMGVKIKYKKKKGGIKQLLTQSVRIQGDYSYMGKKKANMLEISDNIAKMNDKTIKEFSKQIKKNYWQKSDGNQKTMPYEMKKRIEMTDKKMRKKINENNILLEKMRFNLEYENNNLKELVNNIIKEKVN